MTPPRSKLNDVVGSSYGPYYTPTGDSAVVYEDEEDEEEGEEQAEEAGGWA